MKLHYEKRRGFDTGVIYVVFLMFNIGFEK